MAQVLTLIAGAGTELEEPVIAATRATLKEAGAEPAPLSWLAPGIACDIPFAGAEGRAVEAGAEVVQGRPGIPLGVADVQADHHRIVHQRMLILQDHGEVDEVDVARVELIREIRHEFAIDDEALPLVLGLLDQVYELRRQLRRMCDALAVQPPEVQAVIRKALPPVTGPEAASD